jgi:protein phosphatase
MKIQIPEMSLVALVGVSGAGKSTFAGRHFLPTEILSSDACRAIVSDDENSTAATKPAFDVLHFILQKRLAAGKLCVVDATNVQPEARKTLLRVARETNSLAVAIVFNLPWRLAAARNKERPNRNFGERVVLRQQADLRRSLRSLKEEGFSYVFQLDTPEEVDAVEITRVPLWNNRRGEHGPFDIIGDVHGCLDELAALLRKLGYAPDAAGVWTHPEGRKLVFLGDLVDRGPDSPGVVRLVSAAVAAGGAYCVPGNHEERFVRHQHRRKVKVTHGLDQTLAQYEADEKVNAGSTRAAVAFLEKLIGHYVFDDGRLVVAHAGLKEEMQGRASRAVREFALYGETTGETDEHGLPVRVNWAAEYRGRALVVYGHTPVAEPEWLNNTLNIDTGCVFGGRLSALRYPEKEIVSAPAARAYAENPMPPAPPAESALTTQQQNDDLLDIADVNGKRVIAAFSGHGVAVREANAAAALEVMSRFGANPKWLVYLPPTMSPAETSALPGLLEHPAEAFAYYAAEGVGRVVCEEKHMGSRAVVIVCRDENAAARRFGVSGEGAGVCLTRTGRRFFDDTAVEEAFLGRVREAVSRAGLWEELETDWLCLDCELMPWSAKARTLLQRQYAPVGAAGAAVLDATAAALRAAATRGVDTGGLPDRVAARRAMLGAYTDAYQRYCWTVSGVEDLKLAPFHLLASEGRVHHDKPHGWHLRQLSRLAGGIIIATPAIEVETANPESVAAAVAWWESLVAAGGEGMVVKPEEFIARGRHGLAQPALKCRGPEYLRIIYGPEYPAPENLERLRKRGLHSKRSLALREFSLGLEALERFVRREPLRRVHECVLGVLALESEPVDPRL